VVRVLHIGAEDAGQLGDAMRDVRQESAGVRKNDAGLLVLVAIEYKLHGAASEASNSQATRLSHGTNIKSSGRLRSQPCHILVGDAGSRTAEPRRRIIADGGYFGVGVRAAEGRHRHDA
jgi:hypothetical protein